MRFFQLALALALALCGHQNVSRTVGLRLSVQEKTGHTDQVFKDINCIPRKENKFNSPQCYKKNNKSASKNFSKIHVSMTA